MAQLGSGKNAQLGSGKVFVGALVAVLNLIYQKVTLAFARPPGFEKIRPVGQGVKN